VCISGAGRAEVSAFNGREPDASRAGLNLDGLDSFSGRLWWMPTPRLVLQVSSGHLHEAEAEFASQPRSDVHRTTASMTYARSGGGAGMWVTTAAYGVNAGTEIIAGSPFDFTTHAALVESVVTVRERHTWFGRAEVVGKPAHDLHAHEYADRIFTVAKVEAGYTLHLGPWKRFLPGIGALMSLNLVPPELAPRYGGRVAPGFGVFANLRPARHVR
jgi:hypothetical protein